MQPRAAIAATLVSLQVAERMRAALAAAGVPCAFLKGIAFLDTIYTDASARALADIDVLVPESARGALDHVLAPARFAATSPSHGSARAWAGRHTWRYRGIEGPMVEVHFGFCPRGLYPVPYGEVFARLVEYRVAHRRVPTLSPEDTLVSLAIMTATRGFCRPPSRLDELARIIACWPPDWDLVVRRARSWGAAAATYTLLAGGRTRGAAVPDRVLADLAPPRWQRRALAAFLTLPDAAPRFDQRSIPRRMLVGFLFPDRARQRLAAAYHYARRRA